MTARADPWSSWRAALAAVQEAEEEHKASRLRLLAALARLEAMCGIRPATGDADALAR